MAKKHFGKFLAAAVITGAAVGCVAYFTKYRDFQKSLDEDFNDFEEDGEESGTKAGTAEQEKAVSPVKREYVSIPLDTPETSTISDASDSSEIDDFLDDTDDDIDFDSSEAEV